MFSAVFPICRLFRYNKYSFVSCKVVGDSRLVVATLSGHLLLYDIEQQSSFSIFNFGL
jgi:hypothetical protein